MERSRTCAALSWSLSAAASASRLAISASAAAHRSRAATIIWEASAADWAGGHAEVRAGTVSRSEALLDEQKRLRAQGGEKEKWA